MTSFFNVGKIDYCVENSCLASGEVQRCRAPETYCSKCVIAKSHDKHEWQAKQNKNQIKRSFINSSATI